MLKMLLSIHPNYMTSILQGIKLYELRKIRCKPEVSGIIFYVTSPEKCVVAEALIGDILEGSVDDIWIQVKEHAGVSYDFYKRYYNGKERAVAYRLKNVRRYDKPKTLKDYGLSCPPQSFAYVNE